MRRWLASRLWRAPLQPVAAALADGFAASGVLGVACEVADTDVQPDGVVVDLYQGEVGRQRGRVGDRYQVQMFAFDMPVQAFDPGLIRRYPMTTNK